MKFVGKRLENGPPQIMSLFLCLFRVCYIKRTTYKNLHLLFIQYRKPFANRLENTLSVANPYWMIEWRTPCIKNIRLLELPPLMCSVCSLSLLRVRTQGKDNQMEQRETMTSS